MMMPSSYARERERERERERAYSNSVCVLAVCNAMRLAASAPVRADQSPYHTLRAQSVQACPMVSARGTQIIQVFCPLFFITHIRDSTSCAVYGRV